jgi:hypothetical protein
MNGIAWGGSKDPITGMIRGWANSYYTSSVFDPKKLRVLHRTSNELKLIYAAPFVVSLNWLLNEKLPVRSCTY